MNVGQRECEGQPYARPSHKKEHQMWGHISQKGPKKGDIKTHEGDLLPHRPLSISTASVTTSDNANISTIILTRAPET